MILRVDARSAKAQENTSHAVTCPRMEAELVAAFTDSGSFWYSEAAASLFLVRGNCSVIEHQQDQLMYQQTVIDEAGAARTPVHQNDQEKRGKPVDFRIGNEPETLAVDEKLCAELKVNPLGDLSLLGMSDVRKKRVEQLAFMLMMHTKNRAIQMITKLSDPVNGGRERAMLMQLLQCLLTGSRGQPLKEWERLVRQYEAQNVDTLRDTIKAATLAHNPQDSEWCRCVRLSATRQQEYDALKSMWKERGKGKRKGKIEGTSDTPSTKCSFQGKGLSQVPDMASWEESNES